jgi:hypothetical protein
MKFKMTAALDMKSFEMVGFGELSNDELESTEGGINQDSIWWIIFQLIGGPLVPQDPMISAMNKGWQYATGK